MPIASSPLALEVELAPGERRMVPLPPVWQEALAWGGALGWIDRGADAVRPTTEPPASSHLLVQLHTGDRFVLLPKPLQARVLNDLWRSEPPSQVQPPLVPTAVALMNPSTSWRRATRMVIYRPGHEMLLSRRQYRREARLWGA